MHNRDRIIEDIVARTGIDEAMIGGGFEPSMAASGTTR